MDIGQLMKNPTNNKIRVIQILSGGNIGGAERSVQWFAELADRSRFDYFFIFIYYGGPIEEAIASLGYPTKILMWKNGISLIGRLKLIKLILDLDPDLIHDHSQTPFTRVLLKLAAKVPIITTQHGIIRPSSFQWLFLFFDDIITSLVIANSNFIAQKHAQLFRRPISKIATVHMGINTERYKENSHDLPLGGDVEPIRIAYIGRLEELKGIFHVPLLAKELMDLGEKFTINIAGDGPARKACEYLAHEMGMDGCINFLGWKSDVKKVLSTSDILVFLSLYEEGFGLVLLEAIAAGVPVFAYSGGGVGEILENAPYTWVVPKGNYKQMAELIVINKKIIRKRDTLAGYQYVKNHFDIKQTVQKLEYIYSKYSQRTLP